MKLCRANDSSRAAALEDGELPWVRSRDAQVLQVNHRENGGTLGMVPLIINPIYTLCSEYLLGISPFKGLLGGLNSKGTIPRIPYIFL